MGTGSLCFKLLCKTEKKKVKKKKERKEKLRPSGEGEKNGILLSSSATIQLKYFSWFSLTKLK